jgi:hypothetical protein
VKRDFVKRDFEDPETQKPSAEAGFRENEKAIARRYPAGWSGCGRRAREVIPAAMRAEVRTSASA